MALEHLPLFTHYHPPKNNSAVHCVFLHGWGMNSTAWQPVISQFDETQCNVHSYAIDLCGHGRSPALRMAKHTNGNIILDAWLDAIEPQLPASPFYLCGWSLGGLVALAIASRWPERAKGISLIASTPCFTEQENWPASPKKNFTDFSNKLTSNPVSTLRAFIALQFSGAHNNRGDMLSTLKNIRAHGKADALGLQHGLNILMDCDLRKQYAQLAMPTQVLLGTQDILIPSLLLPKLKQLNADASTRLIHHAGHALLFTHSQNVTQWLKKLMHA